MATMSTEHRRALRSRLCQQVDDIDQDIRDVITLAECEHPDWGEPWAEAAHEAALEIVRRKEPRPKKVLTPEMLKEIRKDARVSAGLPAWPKLPNYQRSSDPVKSPRSLQPSSLELAKQENLALDLHSEPEPEDVALPDDNDEDYLLLQQGPAPTCTTTSLHSSKTNTSSCSSPCKTLTTRALAALMRRYDRCAITPAGLEHLALLRDIALKQIELINTAQKKVRAKLSERNRQRWRRSHWRLEQQHGASGTSRGAGGGREWERHDKALALAREVGSPLSFYTSVEDADNPWGQRDARCERERERSGSPLLWVPVECGPKDREVVW